ncbi:MAG: amino acid ABC transporter permease [Candidatus Limiplasma sp.]|nr:amino acid ABC transporter permease [Candidatus Limiplasma sp.]
MTRVGFIESIIRSQSSIWAGVSNTLMASLYAILISTVIGITFGIILTYGNKYVKIPFRIYVDAIRGIPGLVIIFAVYYFIDFQLRSWGLGMPPFVAGFIALSVNASAHVAENTRGALQTIPKGQIDAGKAIGLKFWGILSHILIPQALVRMLPPWVNTITEIVKGSTLLALIGVAELLLTTQQLIAMNNNALQYYAFAGLVYFLINFVVERIGKFAEKKISKGMSV